MSEARQAIAKGSKSFFLASCFFNSQTRLASWQLYRWCRLVDDEVDQAQGQRQALERVQALAAETNDLFTHESVRPECRDLADVCRRFAIPKRYPMALIRGLKMDAEGFRYQTLAQVERYAFRVAGVVGLMMCFIMGVRQRVAHRHAAALGAAMQLTNIARDVLEDYKIGRIYLPEQWLDMLLIAPDKLDAEDNRICLHAIVSRLLARADELYEYAYQGLEYLPVRAALAVSIAGSVYSRIGSQIRARGPCALETRVYVSRLSKLGCVLEGISRVVRQRLSKVRMELKRLNSFFTFGLVGFTLFSWAGYALFVQHPSNLQYADFLPRVFNVAFGTFAQAHVLLCLGVIVCLLLELKRWTWLAAFASVCGICLLAELGGTTLGIPFGLYEYSSLLGPKIFGHVPILIPLSWFAVATCGYAIGTHVFPAQPWHRVVLTALSLVLWDLTLDPAMSYLFSYWRWITKGDYYYGMPLWNLGGWMITGLVIGFALKQLGFEKELDRRSLKFWVQTYSLLIILSPGFLILSGQWTALALSAIAYAGLFVWIQASRTGESVAPTLKKQEV